MPGALDVYVEDAAVAGSSDVLNRLDGGAVNVAVNVGILEEFALCDLFFEALLVYEVVMYAILRGTQRTLLESRGGDGGKETV